MKLLAKIQRSHGYRCLKIFIASNSGIAAQGKIVQDLRVMRFLCSTGYFSVRADTGGE